MNADRRADKNKGGEKKAQKATKRNVLPFVLLVPFCG
jgi:hypothetical protein